MMWQFNESLFLRNYKVLFVPSDKASCGGLVLKYVVFFLHCISVLCEVEECLAYILIILCYLNF